MVGAYFINLVILLDMQLLTVTQQYKSLLQTCPLNHSLKQNYDIAFAFPKANPCQKQLSALKIKNTFVSELWPS